jgi:general secretion pathway protein H
MSKTASAFESATSNAIRTTRVRGQRGFSLIEIMIVLAIIGGMLAIGAPRLFNSSSAMRGAVRKMAVMTRDLRNTARLTNSTMRIVISMDDEKGHSYWIESAPGNVTLLSEEQEKELSSLTSSQQEDQKGSSKFSEDSRVLKSPQTLPRGMYFGGVEYADRKEETTSGTTYVHFFPQGLAEDVAIHLTDRKTLNWTIAIHPLTGRADIFEKKISVKEIRGQ